MNTVLGLALPNEWQIGIVLGLLVIAVVLFAVEVVSVDVITLSLLLALVGTQILSIKDAFSGFSNEIIIIVGSIFVLSGALQETGVMDAVGAKLVKFARGSESRLLLVVMSVVSGTRRIFRCEERTGLCPGLPTADRLGRR
jgi:di/tricarboxylate transporter